MSERIERLERKCKQFSNPFRTEYSALVANEPNKLGVEVVYLKAGGHNTKKPLISVCIPHKGWIHLMVSPICFHEFFPEIFLSLSR